MNQKFDNCGDGPRETVLLQLVLDDLDLGFCQLQMLNNTNFLLVSKNLNEPPAA